MDEKETNESSQTQGEQSAVSQALKEIKENMVPKASYDELKKQNEELAKTIKEAFSGESESPKGAEPEKVDCDELIKELKSGDLSNLDYVKTALKLREERLRTTGEDIFVPKGIQITPDANDEQTAQNVADVFQQCVDGCGGDSGVFTAMLQARTDDIKLLKKKQ